MFNSVRTFALYIFGCFFGEMIFTILRNCIVKPRFDFTIFVNGKFLVWPFSDDSMSNSLEKREKKSLDILMQGHVLRIPLFLTLEGNCLLL